MRQLHVVSVSPDGKSLLLSGTSKNGRVTYRIPIKVTNHGTVAAAKDETTTVKVTLQSKSVSDSFTFAQQGCSTV